MVNNSNQMALKNLRNIKGQTGYRKNESSIESYNSDDQVNEDLKNNSAKDRRRMTSKQENIKHNNLTYRIYTIIYFYKRSDELKSKKYPKVY